ncbi:MAG: CrcB family protein [Acidimicrobiia bacterium]
MASSPRAWIAVGIGGALGTLARYEVALAWPTDAGAFPWSTFAVNVVGSLLVGMVLAWVVTSPPVPDWVRPLVAVGLCGGLTTFSTLMVTDVLLVRDGDRALAAFDLGGNLVVGVLAVTLGYFGVRHALGERGSATIDPEIAD